MSATGSAADTRKLLTEGLGHPPKRIGLAFSDRPIPPKPPRPVRRPCDTDIRLQSQSAQRATRAKEVLGYDPRFLLPAPPPVYLLPAPQPVYVTNPPLAQRLLKMADRRFWDWLPDRRRIIPLPAATPVVYPALPAPRIAGLLPPPRPQTEVIQFDREAALAAAAAKQAPIPVQIDGLKIAAELAVTGDKVGPLYDGYRVDKHNGTYLLCHEAVPDRLVIGLEINGQREFVARRGEVRAYMLQVKVGKKKPAPEPATRIFSRLSGRERELEFVRWLSDGSLVAKGRSLGHPALKNVEIFTWGPDRVTRLLRTGQIRIEGYMPERYRPAA